MLRSEFSDAKRDWALPYLCEPVVRGISYFVLGSLPNGWYNDIAVLLTLYSLPGGSCITTLPIQKLRLCGPIVA